MILTYKPYFLNFKHPFGVSGNTREETQSVFVKLEHEGNTGYGEACLPAYLGETAESTIQFFEKARPVLQNLNLEQNVDEILNVVAGLSKENNAAKAAIDIALNDLLAKINNKSFNVWKGLTKKEGVPTSYTIGIDSEEIIKQKIEEAKLFSTLKIKAGTKDDRELINIIRKHTNKPLYVDVNQGWKSKEHAMEMIHWMADKNIVLLEQPLPKEMRTEMKWLTERSPITTIADESVKRLSDLQELDGNFHGINIKLMKCTGLNEALKMIAFCKLHNIKIMLGCMAESSCGTTAIAQLIAYADFIDLDAPLLYKNDPFKGITYRDGRVYLNDVPGIGVEPIDFNI